jgi:hypothetical protein
MYRHYFCLADPIFLVEDPIIDLLMEFIQPLPAIQGGPHDLY